MGKSRKWCVTINNPKKGDESALQLLGEEATVDWMIFQLEQGEEETPHFQIAIYFTNARTLKGVLATAKNLGGTKPWHWEIMKRSFDVNRKYCSKEEGRLRGPWEFGVMPQQGERSDLTAILEYAKTGPTDIELWDFNAELMARYGVQVKSCRADHFRPRRFWTKSTTFLSRGTGTGKSRRAIHEARVAGHEPMMMMMGQKGSLPWMDGYTNQHTVIIEDFTGEIDYRFLLRMLDWHPLRMPVKGASVHFRPHHVFITSNLTPAQWYPEEANLDPLIRRLTTNGSRIVEMKKWFPGQLREPGMDRIKTSLTGGNAYPGDVGYSVNEEYQVEEALDEEED